MTETHRTNLLAACAYAKTFLTAADLELRGDSPTFREECAYQLAAALRNITTPPSGMHVVDWVEVGRQLDAE